MSTTNIPFAAGTTVAFDPTNDVLQFTDNTSASNVSITQSGSNLTLTDASGSMTLTGVTLSQITSTNVTFSDGSAIIVGTSGTPTTGTTGFNDLIFGSSSNDIISVTSGNNVIHGVAGNHTIDAGVGNDTIYGGSGVTKTITLSSGDDLVYGRQGNNTINLGTGNDTVYGGTGNNTITSANTSHANDSIFGGSGNTSITVGEGNNTISGGIGNDTITGGTGDNVIYGGIGAGSITSNGTDVIYGNPGGSTTTNSITLSATSTGDVVYAGLGNHTITNSGGAATIHGGTGNSTITAGAHGDSIDGGIGNKDIIGGAGADTINGGTGNNTITAGAGNEMITVGIGNGTVNITSAELATATIYGGQALHTGQLDILNITDTSALTLTAASFADMHGFGEIEFTGSAATKNVILSGATAQLGTNIIAFTGTQSGNVTINGAAYTAGHDLDINASALTGTALITGGAGNDTIIGGTVADTIIAGSGSDSLVGGASGNHVIEATVAEIAKDTIHGGAATGVEAGGQSNTLEVTDTGAVTFTGSANIQGIETLNFVGNSTAKTITLGDAFVGGANSKTETVTFTGAQTGNVVFTAGTTSTSEAVSISLSGNAVNSTLIGGAGNDTLVGGSGTTLFEVSSANQTIGKTITGYVGSAVNNIFELTTATGSTPVNLGLDTITNVDTVSLAGGTNIVTLGNLGNSNGSIEGGTTNTITTYGGTNAVSISGGVTTTLIEAAASTAADTLVGGTGVDTFEFSTTTSFVDTISGSSNAANSLVFMDSINGAAPGAMAAWTLTTGGNLAHVSDIANIKFEASAQTQTVSALTDAFVAQSGHVNGSNHVLTIELTGTGTGSLVVNGSAVALATNELYVSGAGSSGNDTITGTALGADTLIGGTGSNTFNINAAAAAIDSIVGGGTTGTNTIALSTAGTVNFLSVATTPTDIEALTLHATTTADNVITLWNDSSDNNVAVTVTAGADASGFGDNITLGTGGQKFVGTSDTNAGETVTTGSGVDTIVGSAYGHDVYNTTQANFALATDSIAGGAGHHDTLVFSTAGTIASADFVHVGGIDAITLATGTNVLTLSDAVVNANGDAVMTITGGTADTINASAATTGTHGIFATGGSGANVITGSAGADTLVGGAGSGATSTLDGGTHASAVGDVLTGGGAGTVNTFVFDSMSAANGSAAGGDAVATNLDSITNFVHGVDKIDLALTANAFGSALTFTGTTVAAVTAETVAGGATLSTLLVALNAADGGDTASSASTAQVYDVTLSNDAGALYTAGIRHVLVIQDQTTTDTIAHETVINITGETGGALTASDFIFH